jgi:hypothetical protein
VADWSFRYRLSLAEGMRINSPETEIRLSIPESRELVLLRSRLGDPIDETRDLALHGSGHASSDLARDAGERWRDCITIAFAAHSLGADFGEQAAASWISPDLSEAQATEDHSEVLHDLHGLMVFPTEPAPAFLGITVGDAVIGKPMEGLLAAIRVACDGPAELTVRERLAFASYTSSFGQPPDARLVTLVSAVELLLEPGPRAAESQVVVDKLLNEVATSKLPDGEKRSMQSHIAWLRKQSIGQSLKAIAHRLGDRRYMNLSTAKFLSNCYKLRSDLVHGNEPVPSFDDVNLHGAELERLVGNLLSISVLHQLDIQPVGTVIGVVASAADESAMQASPEAEADQSLGEGGESSTSLD